MYNFRKPGGSFCSKQDKLPKLYKKPGMSKFVLTFRTSLSLLLVMMVNVYDINMRSNMPYNNPYY